MGQQNRILVTLLERLRSGLLDGPGLNCRPHHSRQRIDLTSFAKLGEVSAAQIVRSLLCDEQSTSINVKIVPAPEVIGDSDSQSGTKKPADATPAPEDLHDTKRWSQHDKKSPYYQQQALLRKLKTIAEDAQIHEQDTGVDVLHLGFPLLHLPPGAVTGLSGKRRLLAPVCLIPVALTLRLGARPVVELKNRSDDTDRIGPNSSLLAWLENSGHRLPENLADDGQAEPWHFLVQMVNWLTDTIGVEVPSFFTGQLPQRDEFQLVASPSAADDEEPSIVSAAVLGLFPINRQALIRDLEAMVDGESLDGPVRSFLDSETTLDAMSFEYEAVEQSNAPVEPSASELTATNERLVSPADPCQARAVRLARQATGLVIHGPPGTGKSQTITNIVGDHLVRGERVLVVSDKRTALDVVADRLNHLGLGNLVAVVHDAGRDQRELYRRVRAQLESLADVRSDPTADRELSRVDSQLEAIRTELTTAWRSLHVATSADEPDFHHLMGAFQGIELTGDARKVYESAASTVHVSRAELEVHSHDLHDLLNKADEVEFADNPWSTCIGIPLAEFLARSGDHHRGSLQECLRQANAADASLWPTIPSFRSDLDVTAQAESWEAAANLLESLWKGADAQVVSRWLHADPELRDNARQRLQQAAEFEGVLRRGSLEAELHYQWDQSLPETGELDSQIETLGRFLRRATIWNRALALTAWMRTEKLLLHYELPSGTASAQRLHDFLRGCQARSALQALHASLLGQTWMASNSTSESDVALIVAFDTHHRVLALLHRLEEAELEPLRERVVAVLSDPTVGSALLDGLRRARSRAAAITKFTDTLRESGLFRESWLNQVHVQLCEGRKASHAIEILVDSFATCEPVVRLQSTLECLPKSLSDITSQLLMQGASKDQCMAVLEKLACHQAVRARLAANPALTRLDGQRLGNLIARYRDLRTAKHTHVAAAILQRWTELQKSRLLAATRSRLNSQGADVRRRLTGQGRRATRLRRSIEVGAQLEDGDPLFNLRPVWMASPETVAQIFPRSPKFDVIVFDEASQCRLEEALPVLLRGRRVVIAGDVKQLPPTRFFESALITSEEAEAETPQDWFEQQQSEVEDLLTAALNLQIEQCYLDVHYRSRNSDLIDFSNGQFYASRLQPLPGHPKNRASYAPITLYHAGGVYEDRVNRVEAEEVCRVVRDLLRRAEPPSIGIACFNTDQRDLILDCLDELAERDADFAGRLAQARARRGQSTSEGLFVKNLESVQGDERDHMVISTTYGPNSAGRFYRRFGPLACAGGGRRLNVLVTRARHEVHLVTSIPVEIYRSFPTLASEQVPNGGWLLFNYLNYAEHLAALYDDLRRQLDERDRPHDSIESTALPARVTMHPSSNPSEFALSLATRLAELHKLRGLVHWGNDGFCIDVAIGHPRYIEDVTIGVLCDFNRFHRAADPIEWEIFRTEMLESQGWQLERVWTPQYARDPTSVLQHIAASAERNLNNEDAKNALRVEP
ncbi:MAG: DUF4011 domain-containing protein [Pirellulales bacterium]|nr:DUF4011 domain-containing protein [Pirellulales bacterium]